MSIKLLFIIKLLILINDVQNKLTLKQVIILNRHSIRSPLTDKLNDITPKVWPKWEEKPGILTAKGATLAGYMGVYFAAWLKKEGILPSDCPNEDDLYVYSNTIERTLSSAQSFVDKGFPRCNIKVHKTGINVTNPIFSPYIHNTSADFQRKAAEEMQEALNTIHLNEAYELLSHIIDYKQSKICEIEKKCNLAKGKHHINVTPGFKPQLVGPLKTSNDIIDTFLMQNYEGFSNENIAWGELTDRNSWQKLVDLNRAYFNVTYKTNIIARDISKPLIKYITNIFLNNEDKPKVTLLVGHDVNFHTIFESLSVRAYSLEKQDELIPIGSAVAFQKWRDDGSNKDYLKITFFYQSMEQLRQGISLSLKSPPMFKILELEHCQTDSNGFCQWDDFKTFLINFNKEFVDTLMLSD